MLSPHRIIDLSYSLDVEMHHLNAVNLVLRREVVFLDLTGILEEFRRKGSVAPNFLWGLVVLVRKDERDSTSTSRILDTTKCSITFQFALQFRRVDLPFDCFIRHKNCTWLVQESTP